MRGLAFSLGVLLLAGCAVSRPSLPAVAAGKAMPLTAAPLAPAPAAPAETEINSLPFWLLDPGEGRAAACATHSAGPDAHRIALAKARAELVRQQQVQVASTLAMTSDASRLNGRAGVRAEWKERVEQNASGLLETIAVLQVETVDWQGQQQLCVWVGPGTLGEKEEAHGKK